MLQSYHHHSSLEEVISILLQWLPSSCTYPYSHEVLWTVSHASHQVCPPPGPLPVCISVQLLDQWRHRHCPPPSPHTSGQKRLKCQNAVHRLQFSIQHYPPSTAHLQTGPACCWTSWLGDLRYYGSAVTHQVHLTEHRGSQECVLSPLLFTLLTHD